MERKHPQTIGDVLRDLLNETSLQGRMDELKAADLWPRVAGEAIARECRRPMVKNGLMTVGVPNASLRQELYLNKTRLKEIINSLIGKEIITEIRFIS